MHNDVVSTPGFVPVFSRAIGSWHISVGRRPFNRPALAAHYDARAAGWQDTVDRFGFGQAYRRLLRPILEGACSTPQQAPLRVLDAGIGTGAMSEALASQAVRAVDLHGVDLSEKMLVQARHRLESQVGSLTLRAADLDALPYPDGAFDMVLAAHVIEHLVEPDRALREISRVLKPGGVVVAVVTRASMAGALIQLMWRTHRVEPARARAWFKQAGLVSVEAIAFAKGTRARGMSVGYVARKPM